jgi:hypothetical protein
VRCGGVVLVRAMVSAELLRGTNAEVCSLAGTGPDSSFLRALLRVENGRWVQVVLWVG